jgi:hypothetical protein
MEFIYELYNSLMWIIEKDEDGNEHKTPYMTINQIDELDFFFYLDMKIYELNKANKQITSEYDSMGL